MAQFLKTEELFSDKGDWLIFLKHIEGDRVVNPKVLATTRPVEAISVEKGQILYYLSMGLLSHEFNFN